MNNMTIEDIKYYKENAIKILRKNTQYATAKATEEAFDALLYINEVVEKFNACQSGYPIRYSDLKKILAESEFVEK